MKISKRISVYHLTALVIRDCLWNAL